MANTNPILIEAIQTGNFSLLAQRIEAGDEVNVLSAGIISTGASARKAQETPLTHATKLQNLDMVCALLDAGADPNLPNSLGDTAATIAAFRNLSGYIPVLYIHSADFMITTKKQEHTALGWAAHSGAVLPMMELLQLGIPPDHRCHKGRSPLAWSLRFTEGECAEILLSYGADPNYMGTDWATPLHCAASNKKVSAEAVNLLLDAGGDVDSADSTGKTARDVAKENGNTPFQRALAKHPATHFLSRLDEGPESERKRDEIADAILSGDLAGLRKACASGLPAPGHDVENSPQTVAISCRNLAAMRLLTTLEAGTKDTDRLGNTPLHQWVEALNDAKREDLALLSFMTKNVDASARNSAGVTPAMRARSLSKFPALATLLATGSPMKPISATDSSRVLPNANRVFVNPVPAPNQANALTARTW